MSTSINIDSLNDLSQHVWWWFTEGRHETKARRRDDILNADMPHWSDFVGEMTREIERGEDLPWIKGATPMSVPCYGDDWTLFLNTVDLHVLAERIVHREVKHLVGGFFDIARHPEHDWKAPNWLCATCTGCRNFVLGRIKL